MRAFDQRAIACGVPGLVLMENAGRGAAEVLVRELLAGDAAGARVAVVCGPGNNGGDGLVLARHLLGRGAIVEALLVGDWQRVTGDAHTHMEAWRGLGGTVRAIEGAGGGAALASADVIVDALFGTGLDRAIAGTFAQVVAAMNAAAAPRFAIDLPSGLDADTGAELGIAVRARATATFAHFKRGLLTPGGASLAGRVHVVDLGVPAALGAAARTVAQRLSTSDVAGWIAARDPAAHKGSAGHVVVVAGSPGKIGAPQLVARGALRGGAGVVTIATWSEVAASVEGHVLEVMTARIDPARLFETLDAALAHKQGVVIGPGLGLGSDAQSAVTHVLGAWRGPLVVDADALSMFGGRPEVFKQAGRAVLTPHPGELARLLGTTTGAVESDRFAAAQRLVEASGAVVVLKGAHTIIAAPDGRVAVSPVACPALATAGSGDVLGGIVGALACALPVFEAACAGVMLHALSGQAWSAAHGGADIGLLASEIADGVPSVRASLRP